MPIKFVQSVDLGANRILNVGAPSVASDAATKTYVDTLLGAAISGLAWLKPARAASTGNVSVSSPGASLDGVTLSNGDRVLLKNQTAGAENGPYVFNGASSALTRTTDTLQSGTVVAVNEGTANSDKVFLLTSDGTITVGTTALTFSAINAAAGGPSYTAGAAIDLTGNAIAVKYAAGLKIDGSGNLALDTAALPASLGKYAANIGDSASDTITVTHGLNTFDVHVSLYDTTSGNRVDALAEIRRPTVNTIQVVFGTAPATGAYRVVVIG